MNDFHPVCRLTPCGNDASHKFTAYLDIATDVVFSHSTRVG